MAGTCICRAIKPLQIEYPNLISNYDILLWLARQSRFIVNSGMVDYGGIRGTLKNIIKQKGFIRGRLISYNAIALALERKYCATFFEFLGYPLWKNRKPSAWLRNFFKKVPYEEDRCPVVLLVLIIGMIFHSIQEFEGYIINFQRKKMIEMNMPDEKTIPTLRNDILEKILNLIYGGLNSLRGIAIKTVLKDSEVIKYLRYYNIRLPLAERVKQRLGTKKLKNIHKALGCGVTKKEIQKLYKCSEWTIMLVELDRPDLYKIWRSQIKKNLKEKHRKTLIHLLELQPNISRSSILQKNYSCHEYLMKHDKEWFYAKVKRKKRINNVKRTDTYCRTDLDDKKSKELLDFIQKCLEKKNKPIWIAKTMCLKSIKFINIGDRKSASQKQY